MSAIEIFSRDTILQTYLKIKNKKLLDRNKKLPIGLDGVNCDVFEKNIDNSINEIHRKLIIRDGVISYKFGPLLRIFKNKQGGGTRMLHIPRLRDQIVLRMIHDEILHHLHYKSISITPKSPYFFVREFDKYTKDKEDAFILKSDLKLFYDTIPRNLAIDHCFTFDIRKEIQELLTTWSSTISIRTDFMHGSSEIKDFSGLPQGLSISSLLSELYALKIDSEFKHDTGYFRYADDFAIVCNDKNDAKNKLNSLNKVVSNLSLSLSSNKTEIIKFTDGFKWLGITHFPGSKYIDSDKLYNTFRPITSIKKSYEDKLTDCANQTSKIEVISEMIREIDYFISGKGNFRIRWYSQCEDQGQWRELDRFIHGTIRSAIRKFGVNESDLEPLPSLHAKCMYYKKSGVKHKSR